MSRYIKNTSTYTIRKKAQNINGGAIYERDWSTLEGQKLRFGNGKTPLYTDGNFVFTTANIQLPSRRSKPNTSVDVFTYEDVKDAKEEINVVSDNFKSNDLRNFAYYGSCVSLVEGAITNILNSFPACLYTDGSKLEYPTEDGSFANIYDEYHKELYIVHNPFNIDLLTKSMNKDNDLNEYRYLCETYDEYEINNILIKGYNINISFDICKENDQWYNFLQYRQNHLNDKQNKIAPIEINFFLDNDSLLKVYGYRYESDVVFLCKDEIVIKPTNEVIEEYFSNLKGFEKQLLNRTSKPLYSNNFMTPIPNSGDGYTYYKRTYTWPSNNEYCIDIESPSYNSFVQGLLNIANINDELCSNNLYNRMTHEAIKNFDWTYSRDYISGEEQDNIDGGLRMQQILYFIGRVFDDIKNRIETIKNSSNITYNGVNNVSNAVLSDKAEMKGWDIVSTIPNIEDDKVITLDENFLNRHRLSWFPTLGCNGFDSTNFDIEFMRRLNLSSKRILSSKGTQESIDMVMGMFGLGRNMTDTDSLTFHEISNIDDYEVTEIYYNAYLNINKSLEEIENININRTSFSDPYGIELFNGLPLGILEIEGTSYIIPFYDKNKEYGHELVFQDKGGWCGNNINNYEYFETISYLNVVTNYEELLYITNLNCKEGDIYYVIDITDCAKYNITDIKSHFFVCVDETKLGTTQGWLNINLKNEDDISKKVNYLNNIVNTKFGNNPHVGYGLYDKGENYREYMDKPFKYWLETADITNENDYNEADNIKFNLTEDNDKKLFTYTDLKNKLNENKYGINSKIVKIKNKHNNIHYKKYFKNTILPYLMQVIPSTTILILEDF